jgi:hypothetical protein
VSNMHISTRDTILIFFSEFPIYTGASIRSRCGERIVLARLLFDFMFDVVGMAIISNINCTVRAGEAREFGPCEVAKMYGHHYPAPCSQNGFSLWLGAVVSLSLSRSLFGLQQSRSLRAQSPPPLQPRRDTNTAQHLVHDGIFIFSRPANYLV